LDDEGVKDGRVPGRVREAGEGGSLALPGHKIARRRDRPLENRQPAQRDGQPRQDPGQLAAAPGLWAAERRPPEPHAEDGDDEQLAVVLGPRREPGRRPGQRAQPPIPAPGPVREAEQDGAGEVAEPDRNVGHLHRGRLEEVGRPEHQPGDEPLGRPPEQPQPGHQDGDGREGEY